MYTDITYLFILSASFGGIIALGAFVAPVVFHTQDLSYLSSALDRYSAGVVMAEVFHRFTYWLYITGIAIVIFEMSLYKTGQRDWLAIGAAFTSLSSILLFNVVYTPRILSLQAVGSTATQSETFENLHFASELDFKLLAIALVVLFFRRVMLLRTIKS